METTGWGEKTSRRDTPGIWLLREKDGRPMMVPSKRVVIRRVGRRIRGSLRLESRKGTSVSPREVRTVKKPCRERDRGFRRNETGVGYRDNGRVKVEERANRGCVKRHGKIQSLS